MRTFIYGTMVALGFWVTLVTPVQAETVSGTFSSVPINIVTPFVFSTSPEISLPGQSITFTRSVRVPRENVLQAYPFFGGQYLFYDLRVSDDSQCFPVSEHIDYRNQHDQGYSGGSQYTLRQSPFTFLYAYLNTNNEYVGEHQFTKQLPSSLTIGRTCQFTLWQFSGTSGIFQGAWVKIAPALTVTIGPPRIKLEARGPTGVFEDTEITVQTGQPFDLRWSSSSSNRLMAGTSPISGCPRAGSPYLIILRQFVPPGGGAQTLTAPNSEVVCTYTASSGGLSDSVVVRVVAPATPPTFSFAITPPSVSSGAQFSLNTSTTNATTITTTRTPALCPDGGNLIIGANQSKSLTAPSVTSLTKCDYTAVAVGPGGSRSRTASVEVTPIVVAGSTISLQVNGSTAATVAAGGNFSLTWTTSNTTAVSFAPPSAGCPSVTPPVAINQSAPGRVLTAPTPASQITCIYTATASGAGTSASSSVQVTVQASPGPTVNLTINGQDAPTASTPGDPFTVAWQVTNTVGSTPVTIAVSSSLAGISCPTISGAQATSGTRTLASSPSAQAYSCSYTASAAGSGGRTANDTVSISFIPPNFRIKLKYDPRVHLFPPPGFALFLSPLTTERNP